MPGLLRVDPERHFFTPPSKAGLGAAEWVKRRITSNIENNRVSSLFHHTSSQAVDGLYPVRNNAPLLPPGQRPSGPAAAEGLHFRIIPAGFNAPLEFLTGFTSSALLDLNPAFH